MTASHCEWKDRGAIVELSLFLESLGPWPTPPAGTATATPTPALTIARALRESWPAPSTTARGRRKKLPPGQPTPSRLPGSTFGDTPAQHRLFLQSGLCVTRCNDSEEDSRLLDLRPYRICLAPEGAQFLLGQVPGPPSPSKGLPAAESFNRNERLTRLSPGNA